MISDYFILECSLNSSIIETLKLLINIEIINICWLLTKEFNCENMELNINIALKH